MYRPINPLGNGFYEAFEYDPRTLPELWSTPEQRAYNESTDTCTECKGYGYRTTRRGKEVVREAVGCPVCHGLGKVPKEGDE